MSRRVVGSIVTGGRARPFLIDLDSGQLELDRYAPGPGEPSLDAHALTLLAAKAGPIEAVRTGEYFCTTCGHWRAADTQHWSYGLCLSCSLDQASELSEMFDDDE
jgi:hypothetical protein